MLFPSDAQCGDGRRCVRADEGRVSIGRGLVHLRRTEHNRREKNRYLISPRRVVVLDRRERKMRRRPRGGKASDYESKKCIFKIIIMIIMKNQRIETPIHETKNHKKKQGFLLFAIAGEELERARSLPFERSRESRDQEGVERQARRGVERRA